ncbi:MAG: ATP-dependent RecD-like DNA helicase [Deltaproteobacteria bacterium]|nr:ATP-dependent RecD-like DNA helicase [Deltaproteobacteria bacterium]
MSGSLRKIIFRDEEAGFAIAAFAPTGGLEEIVVLGGLADLVEGEELEIEGRFEDGKRGRQFLIQNFRPILPTTKHGIQKYLASGVVKGIGKTMAERIVKEFGERTLQILDEDPKRLGQVEGIGRKRVEQITGAWQSRQALRNLTIFLQGMGLSASLAPKLIKAYGPKVVEQIKTNPYDLAVDVRGIGFATADKIAQELGLARDAPERVAAGIVHQLRELSTDGHVAYPRGDLVRLCATQLEVPEALVAESMPSLAERGAIKIETADGERLDDFVYFVSLYRAERGVVASLAESLRHPSSLRDFDADKARRWLTDKHDIHLTDTQFRAVNAAVREKVCVVTGGPGTGKTTIVKAIVEILGVLKGSCELAAPTGRAAKRLSEATGREAKTLHRLLELRPGAEGRGRVAEVDVDVLIVDEASMIDINLMDALTGALSPQTHLVIVGDADQLPSVGPGDVLRDLIECGRFPVVRLTEIFRQGEGSMIVENAHRILQGRPLRLPDGDEGDFFFIQRDDPGAAARTIIDIVADRLPKSFGLDPMTDIQILSPMHRGDVGVANLNRLAQERLNPSGPSMKRGDTVFRVGDRVLQSANDYDRDIFNGDLGRVARIDHANKTLYVDFDGRLVPIDGAALSDLSVAYAISVHKSQGSEYPAVVIPIATQHTIMLQRHLIYTAVTRARRYVVLVGSRTALERAIKTDARRRRYGLLRERLEGMGLDP